MQCLDDPATASALTFKVTYNNRTASTGYINRSTGDAADVNGERAISTLTVMEIAVAVL